LRETGDLNTFRLQVDGAAPASLDDLFDQLCNFYEKAISWYLVEKHRKGRASKMLRIISLLLLVVGGMVPLASAVIAQLNSSIGYILLAFAAGLQLVDRHFGYSSAWMRYVAEAMRLNAHLLAAQVEWQRIRAVENGTSSQWDTIVKYSTILGDSLVAETTLWTQEFAENAIQHAQDMRISPQDRVV